MRKITRYVPKLDEKDHDVLLCMLEVFNGREIYDTPYMMAKKTFVQVLDLANQKKILREVNTWDFNRTLTLREIAVIVNRLRGEVDTLKDSAILEIRFAL